MCVTPPKISYCVKDPYQFTKDLSGTDYHGKIFQGKDKFPEKRDNFTKLNPPQAKPQ